MRLGKPTLGALGAAAVVACGAPAAVAAPENNTSERLRAVVSADGILEHERAFESFAAGATGNRLSGAPGHDASALYVADRMRAAGYRVATQEFEYDNTLLADYSPPVLAIEGGQAFVPGIVGGQLGGDFGTGFDANAQQGDVTAGVWAVDLQLPQPDAVGASTSGCEKRDFNRMPAGSIALVQRGTCPFVDKQENAEQAGAAAVIIFNDGFPDRTLGVWTDASGQDIPVLDASTSVGQTLANGVESGATNRTARVRVDWRPGTYTTSNVIAESTGGDPGSVIAVGAHLDSVGTGPGINDNGSGSSAILEIAEQMSGVASRNRVRFIWFGAEESGLLGSTHYVEGLSGAERDRITAMLNFDMIGSPNFVRFVYDGDNSTGEGAVGPDGSDQIEAMFLDYFANQGLATEPTAFDGRSDYGPFIEAGIPAGGLFTGAEGIKSAEQAAVFGGVAGEAYDPCYHQGCDTLLNLSNTALEEMGDASAHATISLAQSTPGIGGTRGKGNQVPSHALPKPAPKTAR
jgi:Zn-dependent M28 family amino/carboxypeptidase